MSREILPPAVVLGLSPTGLHVVRSLGRAGVSVIGVAEGEQTGQTSRYLGEVIHQTGDAQLLDALLALAIRLEQAGQPTAILIPSSDQHVDFIAGHADVLSERFRFQTSYSDGLAQAIMAKDSFYRLCDAHGIHYPNLVETRAAELLSLVDTVAFPWIIKPAEIHRVKAHMRGEKGWIVTDKAELEGILPLIPANADTLLVQEIIPGPESEITLCCAYFDDLSKPRQMFTARKLRQYPPGFGSASLVQSHAEPDSAEAMTELLGAVGYRGIAAGEFKRHPKTGKLMMIEVNVRPSLWFSISQEAKRPVVLEAYRDMAGLPPLANEPQEQGVRWKYTLKDLASALFYRLRRGYILPVPDTDICGAAVRKVYPVFAEDDGRPAYDEVRLLVRKALFRLTAQPNRPSSDDS